MSLPHSPNSFSFWQLLFHVNQRELKFLVILSEFIGPFSSSIYFLNGLLVWLELLEFCRYVVVVVMKYSLNVCYLVYFSIEHSM